MRIYSRQAVEILVVGSICTGLQGAEIMVAAQAFAQWKH